MIAFSGRAILLDIEGTTSSISFVHDVMFPYVREHLSTYLNRYWSTDQLDLFREQLARDDGASSWKDWLRRRSIATNDAAREAARQQILKLMDVDSKSTGLKTLQGMIWASGFHSGQLQAHVFEDVLPAIESWRDNRIDVRIYSSGSIAAQRLFFGHIANRGDCLHLFSGHYDTTIGSKRESASYQRLATDWGLPPNEILFVSDIDGELSAASQAGLQVAASIRPGNTPLPDSAPWPRISTFAEIATAPTSR